MDFEIDLIIYKLLAKFKGFKILDFSAVPLFGDASSRAYFRVTYGNDSAILMKVGDVKTGEFGRGDSFFDFIKIRDFLDELGLKTPKIYSILPEQKAMLLEDLGDVTLFKTIESDKKNKIKHIKLAVELLANLQNALYTRKRFDTPADKRHFTAKLFMEEFYHFYEYMIVKRVYNPPYKNVWPKLEKCFFKISHELSQLPYSFSHRDFQSKNVMIKDGEAYLIDFQDALTAPAIYDLVSLLRDSYVVLADDETDSMLKYFWDVNGATRNLFTSFELFERAFYLQTIQRKMKDAGRFIYLNQVKGKEQFIPYVSPTLFYVKEALLKLEMDKILKILAPFIPELEVGEKQ